MTTTSLKETPLADAHRALGARMVDFAGWNMPVQYKSIVQEHMATRTKVGLFDVSHMGEFLFTGDKAWDFLQYMVPNDLKKLKEETMRAVYTQLVRESGGTVDDLIIYRRKDDFLLVVNASNIAKDWQWLSENAKKYGGVEMVDISDKTGLLALQGPKAVELFSEIAGSWVSEMQSFHYGEATVDGVELAFGRTGYTGEDGFEIMVPADKAEWLWNKLMKAGEKFEIEPCGLGARDTLRLEASLPLYGHELEEHISPIQAGLGWSVKLKKGDFIGREVLDRQKNEGADQVVICLKAEGRALPRQGYDVYHDGAKVGQITSGSQGIFVGYPIAFALVDSSCSKQGTALEIEIRDKRIAASVVPRPFYKR
ncbi:MAG: glycine cleavage system aminomethyltransferase GcvT [Cyanobacteria bacterium]|nr:glycine cleavage system aminomethyltransferase GcvT [Cyanobacteriota bacterium]